MGLKDEISEMLGKGTSAEGAEGDSTINQEGEDHGERQAEAGTEQRGSDSASGEQEGEVNQDQDEPEESLEQRYSNLLNEFNRINARMLEMEDRNGAPVREREAPQTIEGAKEIPKAQPVQTALPEFSPDDALYDRAMIENDPSALKEIIGGLVTYVKQLADPNNIREQVLLGVPDLVRRNSDQRVTLLLAVDNFYKENKDLLPYAPTVGTIVNEVIAKEPELSLAEVLDKVETRARKTLGLKKTIAARDAASDRAKPAFVKGHNARRTGPPEIQGVAKDIADMLKAQNR